MQLDLWQNMRFKCQKLQTINVKPDNLFKHKALKIKFKYENSSDNKFSREVKVM